MAQVVQPKLEFRFAACLLMEFPDVDHMSGLASLGGETPRAAHPSAEHSVCSLGQWQGPASRTRFTIGYEHISFRQMYVHGLEAEHLGRSHAGGEDQDPDILQCP